MANTLTDQNIAALLSFDTCAIANAIECFEVRLRNEGYTNSSIRCRLPSLPPMVGYAVTMRIRTSSPSSKTKSYIDRDDWWSQLMAMPVPHVLVAQDMDHNQLGSGAFIGEIHAAILQALGCSGAVTNGSVRDLPGIESLGFQVFSGDVSPSHAYAHVVEVGGPVEIAGLRIQPGELLHGDQHGIVRIPIEIADKIPEAARQLQRRERVILKYCRSADFSSERLREMIDSFKGDNPAAQAAAVQPS